MKQYEIKPTVESINQAVSQELQGNNHGIYGRCADNGIHKICGATEENGVVYAATYVGWVPVETANVLRDR